MAAVVSSTLLLNLIQADGRRYLTARFLDTNGDNRDYTWLVPGDADVSALIAARAAQLEIDLPQIEIDNNIAEVTHLGSLATPTLRFSTLDNNLAALRVVYLTATQVEAVMIGDYLSARTDAQLRTAFNLTQTQVTSLRTSKLTPAATTATQIRAATGA